jgi:hypothetical protein
MANSPSNVSDYLPASMHNHNTCLPACTTTETAAGLIKTNGRKEPPYKSQAMTKASRALRHAPGNAYSKLC